MGETVDVLVVGKSSVCWNYNRLKAWSSSRKLWHWFTWWRSFYPHLRCSRRFANRWGSTVGSIQSHMFYGLTGLKLLDIPRLSVSELVCHMLIMSGYVPNHGRNEIRRNLQKISLRRRRATMIRGTSILNPTSKYQLFSNFIQRVSDLWWIGGS